MQGTRVRALVWEDPTYRRATGPVSKFTFTLAADTSQMGPVSMFPGFIQEVEHALGLGPAKQCPLREFLTVYIKNIFLNQVLAEINKEIEGVTKTSDPLKILANADTMKVLGVQRPLLQSTSEKSDGSRRPANPTLISSSSSRAFPGYLEGYLDFSTDCSVTGYLPAP
ncbi:hypothetical protein J1605_009575 [Eschrichtius robustus]|uniref:Uncharacterized protein n=1 Tax=Eschrichtius robustus TaxID=9764 RepID=A0AB34GUY4_ESCRO|nr:hypothetical protein J1605_009575 [Eschrichtius robustus]